MYNLLIATTLALIVFLGIGLAWHWMYAVVPAAIVFTVITFWLARRVGQGVEREVAAVVPLLQAQKIDEARAQLVSIKERWGKWQVLISQQIDAQLGMIEYLQMKWDTALPLLQSGSWRNWTALVAIGCIHWRKSDREAAWKSFQSAESASPKEMLIYLVHATLRHKAGQEEEALKVLNGGLKQLPNHGLLTQLQSNIANKRSVDTKSFPQTWFQFFPEELAHQQMIRGRSTPPERPAPVPTNRKMRRSQ